MHGRDIRFASPMAPRHQIVLYPRYLDEVVPPDAPVRALAALLDEVDWTPWEQAYAGYGQPPIHPCYLAGAILWGLLNRVRSTRGPAPMGVHGRARPSRSNTSICSPMNAAPRSRASSVGGVSSVVGSQR